MATIMLKKVRLSYPSLFVPKQYNEGRPRYGANLLIVPGSENDQLIRAEIKKVAAEKWGKKADLELRKCEGNSHKFCYHDGNMRDTEGYQDMMYLAAYRAESQGAPKVVDKDKTELTAASGKPYSGCYVNAKVDIYAQTTGQYSGIRCGLVAIQFAADGDAFGGGAPATADGFDDISDGGLSDDDENDMWDQKASNA